MALFSRPKENTKELLKKTQQAVTHTSVKGGINQLKSTIELAKSKLSNHRDDYILIQDVDTLKSYCSKIEQYGEGAIDTETTGLNPLLVDLVGVCLYVPNEKACYIPINHTSYITGERIKGQLTEKEVAPILNSIKPKWIMHNAKYDIRVLRHTLNIDLECYWDTNLAANCINENESHKLKDLHLKYCDSKDTESLKFATLFDGIQFDKVPIDVAYLYAAGDPIKTYELYQYQKKLLNRRVLTGPYNIFRNIEMPVLKVCCNMEDRGVTIDFDKANELSKKYNVLKVERQKIVEEVLNKYSDKIKSYKDLHSNCKLSNPINIGSPTQLAILFYDILGLTSPDKNNKRGTGVEILTHWMNKNIEKELCQSILDLREVDKLLSTYIEKIPEVAIDGRVHCSFNQYGAKTGRFSSSDFNLQNIPSHNKEIRQMFKAQDGYVIIGSDFSQQEPMVTAHLSNDKTMQNAFITGKDIYATIASLSFNKPYDECLEFRPDGSTNKEGKERRGQAKKIVLGVLYGRSVPSIAEQLNTNTKEAQKIYDKVMDSFPALKKFIDESQSMAKELGYVTTAWGRRRHLPDMQLNEYEFSYKENVNFDPLNFTTSQNINNEVPNNTKRDYINRLNKAYGRNQKEDIKREALSKGIIIHDNGGKIAQAQRQCVNARVQGSSADTTKLAMIAINNDEIMKQLDFHIIIQVHDEILGECPIENAKKAAERLSYLMRTAPTELIKLPFKCDCEITKCWYGERMEL